jgi:TonB family protein
MIMKSLFAALVLAATPALALDVPPVPAGDFADIPCAYPAAALKAQAQGSTVVSFVGQWDGSVKSVQLVRSSGNADLDQATMTCVGQWHFDGRSKIGKRWLGQSLSHITWDIAAGRGRSLNPSHDCELFYPARAVAARSEGTALISFTITDEGMVKAPAILKSSGVVSLDRASLTCVQYWRYQPAIRNGETVSTPWQAQIVWKLPPAPQK